MFLLVHIWTNFYPHFEIIDCETAGKNLFYDVISFSMKSTMIIDGKSFVKKSNLFKISLSNQHALRSMIIFEFSFRTKTNSIIDNNASNCKLVKEYFLRQNTTINTRYSRIILLACVSVERVCKTIFHW